MQRQLRGIDAVLPGVNLPGDLLQAPLVAPYADAFVHQHGQCVLDAQRSIVHGAWQRLRGHFGRGGRVVLCDGEGGGTAHHHAFQKRVAGQPVGAVQAGAGHFAHGMKTRHIGVAVHPRHHAAAGIVRARGHGNGLAGDVDAVLCAQLHHAGKVLRQPFARLMRDVEMHMRDAVLLHFCVDRTGDDVARRKFGAVVVGGHEAFAAG
ncbi:hypothetical protein SDC9_176604 [bioreactor metagenome]|uniref:Uncharacterized protein n=1 Tax=bioreactor metagenome TaxID=1076179 RepID=A0A645GZU8_9ZZZZ